MVFFNSFSFCFFSAFNRFFASSAFFLANANFSNASGVIVRLGFSFSNSIAFPNDVAKLLAKSLTLL